MTDQSNAIITVCKSQSINPSPSLTYHHLTTRPQGTRTSPLDADHPQPGGIQRAQSCVRGVNTALGFVNRDLLAMKMKIGTSYSLNTPPPSRHLFYRESHMQKIFESILCFNWGVPEESCMLSVPRSLAKYLYVFPWHNYLERSVSCMTEFLHFFNITFDSGYKQLIELSVSLKSFKCKWF